MTSNTQELIPLCIPQIQGNEWDYIKDCLDTGWVSSVGSYVQDFENNLARYVGHDYGVATVNGTAALHIALMVAGVERGDEVLVSTLTFISPVNSIRYIGAHPVFIDSEPNFWQMDSNLAKKFVTQQCETRDGKLYNKVTGRRIAAIVPVHILGHPVEMETLLDISKTYDIPIVEDATESLGAKYKGKMVGAIGDISCFSFNGNKLLTTGGGGMILTSREDWAERAKYLTTQAKDDDLEYIHHNVGYNYRLTNIQAAMGVAQLEQIETYLAKKKQIATTYETALSEIDGIDGMAESDSAESAFWLYSIYVNPDKVGKTSRDLLAYLHDNKIQARPLWQPIHISPSYADYEFGLVGGDVALDLNANCLSIPCSVGLTDAEQERVITAIREFANS